MLICINNQLLDKSFTCENLRLKDALRYNSNLKVYTIVTIIELYDDDNIVIFSNIMIF